MHLEATFADSDTCSDFVREITLGNIQAETLDGYTLGSSWGVNFYADRVHYDALRKLCEEMGGELTVWDSVNGIRHGKRVEVDLTA